jgi:hypothetical protein
MAGETIRSPWPPLAIRSCILQTKDKKMEARLLFVCFSVAVIGGATVANAKTLSTKTSDMNAEDKLILGYQNDGSCQNAKEIIIYRIQIYC